MPKFMKYSW